MITHTEHGLKIRMKVPKSYHDQATHMSTLIKDTHMSTLITLLIDVK